MVKELSKTTDLELPESFLAYLEKGHKNKTIYQTKSTEEKTKLESLIEQADELYQWAQAHSLALDSTSRTSVPSSSGAIR